MKTSKHSNLIRVEGFADQTFSVYSPWGSASQFPTADAALAWGEAALKREVLASEA